MAANTNLITSFIRRISKYFNSSSYPWPRPKRVAPGANHIDNPTDFDARTIYRGEEIVDFTKGKLYTQDGGEIVELNSPNQIVNGLRTVNPSVVGAFGGGALFVSVESGASRIYGKNYYHESAGGTAVSGDIQIAPNSSSSKGRIDIIAAKSDYPNPAPVGIVGTFGTDSTEYAAGLTAIAGVLHNQGRALTFVADYPGSGNTITVNSVISATTISVGNFVIGPNIPSGVTATAITTTSGLITSIDISSTPLAASTNATYALPFYSGDVYAIKGDIVSGSNTMSNVYPQPLLGDIIIGEGFPGGTTATNVATPGTVILSSSATITATESIFQIGDVVDHILYNSTPLPDDHLLLGLVYVPNNYTALSSPNILRPWSVSDIWNSNDIENQTPNSIIYSKLRKLQEYASDTTYMSGTTIIDPQTQSIARVVKNHYSSNLATSLSSGAIVKIASGGAGGGSGTTPDLDQVLTVGNNAGANNIDMNNNDLLNVGLINGVAFPQTLPIEIQAAGSDETTALTAGTALLTFRLPSAFTLTGVRASLTTAQATGSIFTVDINQGGSSVLGTKLTIDNTELTSVTAATPATITTSALTDDAEITIDIDQIGDGTATGLKITLIGTR